MSKIRKSANGQECQVRIPFVCNYDPSTTVLAHLNGGGMGAKKHDIFGAYACSKCHAHIDANYDQHTMIMFYEGVFRTQELLIKQELIRGDWKK